MSRTDDDLLPADAAGVVRVVHARATRVPSTRGPREDHLEPHRVQPADAARERERVRDRPSATARPSTVTCSPRATRRAYTRDRRRPAAPGSVGISARSRT